MPPKEKKKESDKKAKIKNVVKTAIASDSEIDKDKPQKPENQLVLTVKEIEEEITKVLTVKNPIKPDNPVLYNYKTGYYELLPDPGDTVVLFNFEGTILERGTQEYKNYLIFKGENPADIEEEAENALEEEEEEVEKEIKKPVADEGIVSDDVGKEGEEEEEEEGEEGEAREDMRAEEEEEQEQSGPKKVLNMFNYSERAALTYLVYYRTGEAQTFPPPRATYSNQVHQWMIYDALNEDHEKQEKLKEGKKKKPTKKKGPTVKKLSQQEVINKKLAIAANVLERMINQNTYNDIAQDYRFWDDPADEFKEGVGTLLPLWKFSYDKAKKMTVTDIRCNPWYYDLFAVTFGSFDFTNRLDEGYMCLFTVKNPSYPESICKTNTGVMCVDIHPTNPYFVVVGLYDGNVYVYNVQQTTQMPQFRSDPINQKHTDIVWEVQWAKDLPDGDLNFFSISGDGKVNQWVLLLNSFSVTTVMSLYMDSSPIPGPDGTLVRLLGCGSCLRLHPDDPQLYMVGTEEGSIYKCSTEYSFLHIVTYPAHDMPVYRIDFNHYNNNIFISCSGDWRIKIWEDGRTEPLFVFDLGTCVGDVRWAPYSSTVFAAVTNDGKVHIYDINVNKYKPMCVQSVVNHRKNKLTRLAFNNEIPIILVGDDKGTISSLKLSPNLRLQVIPTKKQIGISQSDLQKMKLDKILSLMREPKVLERPPDVIEEET